MRISAALISLLGWEWTRTLKLVVALRDYSNGSPQGSDAKLIEMYEYQARGCMQNAEMAADSNLRHLLLKTAPGLATRRWNAPARGIEQIGAVEP